MYDNENYGHDNNNRPADGGMVGNFSGASAAGFSSQENISLQPTVPWGTVDADLISVQEQSAEEVVMTAVQEQPAEEVVMTAVQEQPAEEVVMTAVQEQPAEGVVMTAAQEQPAEEVVLTSVQTQASNEAAGASSWTQASNEAAGASSWTQASNEAARTSAWLQASNEAAGASSWTQASNEAAGASSWTQASNEAARTSSWTQASVQHTDSPDHMQGNEEKKMGLVQKLMLSISLGLFFGIFAGIGFFGVMQMNNAAQSREPEVIEQMQVPSKTEKDEIVREKTPQIQQAGSNVIYTVSDASVSGIVKDVMPAMVSIINNYTETSSFWGQTYTEEFSASGSGIIVAENGEELLIVTNQHVVADADQLLVTLSDDTQVEAKIKGMDAEMDLAVIAIRLEDLSSETMDSIAIANLGDSDSLELGERVIAIGNALGYGQSVTVGYISALDRELELDDGSVRTFIQTDAAINPGNSGGALLNSAGEVIGINSNKIGGSSIEGMGYAIPITAASPIIADLMERQTRDKVDEDKVGYLGISPQDISSQIAQMYGMPEGVYVLTVYEDSGAEAAGIVKGDIITKFDGDKISSFSDLQNVLQYYAVGDTVKVTIMHPQNGEYVEKELTLTLGERPVSKSR